MALQNFQTLVNSACLIAGKDGIDRDAVAEMLAPIVFQQVARKYAADDLRRPMTLSTVSLSFTNGVATPSAQILTEFLKYGVMANAADDTMAQKFRYVSWLEFTRPLTSALGYFAINTDMVNDPTLNIYVTLPGSTYTPGSGFTGTLTLTTPIVPVVPGAAGNALNIPLELQQDLILTLARAITGDWAKEVAA